MFKATLILSLITSLSLFAEVNNEAEYLEASAKLDKDTETTIIAPAKIYFSASAKYVDKKYSKAKDEVKASFKSAHGTLNKAWGGDPKDKRVPDQFVKKMIEAGISEKSFDSMVMSISGLNAIDSCEAVRVAKPKAGTFEQLVIGPNQLARDMAFGVSETAGGYMEPLSHHFFKAASAIYFLGLHKYQEQYLQKADWIKEYSSKAENSSQNESLKVNVRLMKIGKEYIEKQLALKKAYKEMITTAGKIALEETMVKANRKVYRSERKGSAKKDYKKKKPRAQFSSAAAREAVKAYKKYQQTKYEYDQSTVHTHITCDSLGTGSQAFIPQETGLDSFLLNMVFPKAMAEEDPATEARFKYYLEYSNEQNKETNLMIQTPENRAKFFTGSTMATIDSDITETGGSLETINENWAQVADVYDQFTEEEEGLNLEGEVKSIKSTGNINLPKGLGSSILSQSDSIGTNAVTINQGASGGVLGTSDTLNGVAGKIKRSNEEMEPTKFIKVSGNKKTNASQFLDAAANYSLADVKSRALKKLKLQSAESMFSSFRRAPKLDVAKVDAADKRDLDKSKGSSVASSRKALILPDIDDDPAMRLLKMRKKKKKDIVNMDIEPISEETLAKLKSGQATDINDDRKTSIWTIISNRYVRSGYKNLMELKN